MFNRTPTSQNIKIVENNWVNKVIYKNMECQLYWNSIKYLWACIVEILKIGSLSPK